MDAIGGMRETHSPSKRPQPSHVGTDILARMNFLRRLFVVLLCLMLPLTGMAASGLAGAYAMPMPAAMADGPDCAPMADMPDCATMAQASSQAPSYPDSHGHSACKMTTQCQLGSLYTPTPAPAAYLSLIHI